MARSHGLRWGFNALLGAMLLLILLVGQFRDAQFGFVLIANTLIGIVQELRAKRTLDRLSLLTAPKARGSCATMPSGRSPFRRWFWTTSSSLAQETRSSWTARCSCPRGWRSTNRY
jgi:hypothetical protein